MEESKQSKVNQYKYHAFISYRHADNKEQGRQWATWLHQAIETYEVPKDLVGKKNGRGDAIPARIYPIFRDEEELPAHADLGTSIVGALEQTNLLVVLCSPRAVASTYVADEIDYFKKLGGSDRIIAAMIDGEPNTSWDDSKQKLGFTKEDECFPLPLQFEYDQEGNPTDKHAEPIAADFRINNDGKPEEGFTTPAAYREHLKATSKLDNQAIDKKVDSYQQQLHLMLLKIIAGILGVPLGELTQRDKEYQLEQERLKAKRLRQWLGAVAMLAILAIGAGVFAYLQKEEAQKQELIANKATEEALIEKNRAEQSQKEAIYERNKALSTQSTFIMKQAESESEKGNFDTAILLGLNALPGEYGGDRPDIENKAPLMDALMKNNIFLSFEETSIEDYLFSGDGNYFLVKLKTGIIEVWEINTGKLILTHKPTSKVQAIDINYDGSVIAYGTGSEIVLLSIATGEVLKTIKEDYSEFKLSKYGSKLAFIYLNKIKVYESEGNSHIWNMVFERSLSGTLYNFRWSPSGKQIFTYGFGGGSNLVSLESNSDDMVFKNSIWSFRKYASFSQDGTLIALAEKGEDGNPIVLKLYATQSKKLLIELSVKSLIRDISISPQNDGVLISTRDGLIFWDTEKNVTKFLFKSVVREGYKNASFNKRGDKVAAITDRLELYVWNKNTSNLLHSEKFSEHIEASGIWNGEEYIIAYSNSGRLRVAATLRSKNFRLYDLESLSDFEGESLINSKLALGIPEQKILHANHSKLRLIDLKNQKVLWEIEPAYSNNNSCFNNNYFVKENNWIICNSTSFWSSTLSSIFDLGSGKEFTFSDNKNQTTSFFINQSKLSVLLTRNVNNLVKNTKDEPVEKTDKDGVPLWLLGSFTSENSDKVKANKRLEKSEKKIFPLKEIDHNVYEIETAFDTELAFLSTDARTLVTQSKSRNINVWDVKKSTILHTLKGRVVAPPALNENEVVINTLSGYSSYNFMSHEETELYKGDHLYYQGQTLSPNKEQLTSFKRVEDNAEDFINVQVISLLSGKELWETSFKNGSLKNITYSDNSKIIALDVDGKVSNYTKLFSSMTGKELLSDYIISDYAYQFIKSGDQILFRTSSNDLILWDFVSSKKLRKFSFSNPIDSFVLVDDYIYTLHKNVVNQWSWASEDDVIAKALTRLTPNYKCLTSIERESFFLPQLTDEENKARNCMVESKYLELTKNKTNSQIISMFSELYKQDINDLEVVQVYAEALYDAKKYSEVAVIYSSFDKKDLLTTKDIEVFANSLYFNKQYNQAFGYFQSLYEEDHYNSAIDDNYALALYHIENYAKAGEIFKRNFKVQKEQGFSTNKWAYSIRMYGLSILKSENEAEYQSAHQLVALELKKIDHANYEWQYSHLTKLASGLASKIGDFKKASIHHETYLDKSSLSILSNSFDRKNIGLLKKRTEHYLAWSWYQLYNKEFASIIMNIPLVIDKLRRNDENTITLHTNLAHAYLLSGDYQTAKTIYKKYKGFKLKNGNTWDKAIIADFKALEKGGITHLDFSRIAKEVFGVDLDVQSEINTKEAA